MSQLPGVRAGLRGENLARQSEPGARESDDFAVFADL